MISNNLQYGMMGYLDGNYNGDPENQKSIMGYCFFANGAIQPQMKRITMP